MFDGAARAQGKTRSDFILEAAHRAAKPRRVAEAPFADQPEAGASRTMC
ncbi:type II toxin -antitoxin system TacA 1-like antitoxin [Xanthobacter versatilis]